MIAFKCLFRKHLVPGQSGKKQTNYLRITGENEGGVHELLGGGV